MFQVEDERLVSERLEDTAGAATGTCTEADDDEDEED